MSNTIPLPEPAYYQWRRKKMPWSLEFAFSHMCVETTDDSEVRTLHTADQMHTHAAAVSAADNAALREQVQALQSEVIRATNFELDAGRVMRHEPMLNGFEDLWVIEAEFDALREWVKVLEDALQMCVEQFQKPFQLHVSEGDLQALDAARAALGDKTP